MAKTSLGFSQSSSTGQIAFLAHIVVDAVGYGGITGYSAIAILIQASPDNPDIVKTRIVFATVHSLLCHSHNPLVFKFCFWTVCPIQEQRALFVKSGAVIQTVQHHFHSLVASTFL
jgi:hypothetical protein